MGRPGRYCAGAEQCPKEDMRSGSRAASRTVGGRDVGAKARSLAWVDLDRLQVPDWSRTSPMTIRGKLQ